MSIDPKAVRRLAKAIDERAARQAVQKQTVVRATVTSDEQGALRAVVDGCETETPCDATVAVSVGDRVDVRIQEGEAVIVGNATQPSVGETSVVRIVQPVAKAVTDDAVKSQILAGTAIAGAESAMNAALATRDGLYVSSHTITSGKAIAPVNYLTSTDNSDGSVTITRADSGGYGWYPLGVVGWHTSMRYVTMNRAYLTDQAKGTCHLHWMLTNWSDKERTPSATVRILWARVQLEPYKIAPSAGSGSVTQAVRWGEITGEVLDQGDLAAELSARVSSDDMIPTDFIEDLE